MKTGRLIVIDDDANHRTSLTSLLTEAGHEIVGAGSGVDAAGLLAAAPDADVLLLDLNMPEVSGYDVLVHVRTLETRPSVIVLTAERAPNPLRRLLQLGASDYLQKPYEPDELLRSILTALYHRGQEAAAQLIVERLRASERLHQFLVEQSPDVIYTLDGEGRFTFLSASAEQVFGRSADSLIGEHWTVLFAPGERELARRRFDERRTGRRATRNLELRLADVDQGDGPDARTPRWVQISATGLYGSDEDSEEDARGFEGSYGIARDVTAARIQRDARTQLESQLEQARRMEAIGQLAGGIAHDFNNILASMLGFAELAQVTLDAGSEGPATGYLDEVVGAGQRARDLIAQLLNFSRPDVGSPRVVHLDDEIETVTRMLRAVIPASIRIETEVQPPGRRSASSVFLDPVQLQQVLLNLFINARDAVAENGVIRVRVADRSGFGPARCDACGEPFEGDLVEVEVADNGIGIPPEILRRLFEPQVSARPGGRGTGFGLTLIEKIIHRHGGHLLVESARGKGTAFRLYLPVSSSTSSESIAAAEPEAETPPPAAHARSHVVIVDDEVSVANFLRELLEHSGYTTTVFNDPESALDFLTSESVNVDLVVSDQTMPRLTGSQLAKRIADLDQAPPVILCTGYGLDAALDQHDIAAVLSKPFEIPELLRAIERQTGAT